MHGSVAHIEGEKKKLVHDAHRLSHLGVRLVDQKFAELCLEWFIIFSCDGY